MAIPKRPAGDASQQAPPAGNLPHRVETPKKSIKESLPEIDFALPSLDSIVKPSEVIELPEIDITSKELTIVETDADSSHKKEYFESVADSLSINDSALASTNQHESKPSQTAVSDELDTIADLDEDELDRLLGITDTDDESEDVSTSSFDSKKVIEDNNTNDDLLEKDLFNGEETFEIPEVSPEIDKNLTPQSVLSSEEIDFDELMRSLSEDQDTPLSEEVSESESLSESSESVPTIESNSDEDNWDDILALLDAPNESDSEVSSELLDLPVETQDIYADIDENEEDNSEDDEFALPSLPKSFPSVSENTALSDGIEDEDDDDDDDEWSPPLDEEFVPPENPFAIPTVGKKKPSKVNEENQLEDDSEDVEFEIDPHLSDELDQIVENKDEDSEDEDKADSPSLKEKISGVLSVSAIKTAVVDYFAVIKAELNGEDPPKSKSSEKGKANEEEDEFDRLSRELDEKELDEESENEKGESSQRKGKNGGVFGFLSPVKSLYLFVVNFFFGILTAVLGILSNLPLVGFVFKAALGATQILKVIANYLPIVFIVGALVLTSYLSIPRESKIELPDSGGATLTSFSYDSEKKAASGEIKNTGDIIAKVGVKFKVYSIQPTMSPKSWVIPQEIGKCASKDVEIDIDDKKIVSVKCSGEITGYLPRVSGELIE
jgi:hypothetical protein